MQNISHTRSFAAVLILYIFTMAHSYAGEQNDIIKINLNHVSNFHLSQKDMTDEIVVVFVFDRCAKTFSHASLIINSDARTIYDPGGSWMKFGPLPKRGFFENITIDDTRDFFQYHLREKRIIATKKIQISEDDLNIIREYQSKAPLEEPGQCALRVSRLLKSLPRFNEMEISLFPRDIFYFLNQKYNSPVEIFLHENEQKFSLSEMTNSSKWHDVISSIYNAKFSWLGYRCPE